MNDQYEQSKYAYEQKKHDAERAHDQNNEFFHKVNEAAITTGTLAIRMSLLVNGGAAISMLAFIGHLDHAQMVAVAGGLAWFAWGAASAIAGIGLACYLTNYYTSQIAASKEHSWEPPFVRDTAASKRAEKE